jgi:hypothetical protein
VLEIQREPIARLIFGLLEGAKVPVKKLKLVIRHKLIKGCKGHI